MTISFNTLFGQRDVRETNTSSTAVTGTLYWTIAGTGFISASPDVDDMSYQNKQVTNGAGGDRGLHCSVNLPHGALITSVTVYGDDATDTWALHRGANNSGATSTIASGNINSADTTISNATVSNSGFTYSLVATISNTKNLFGAAITYVI